MPNCPARTGPLLLLLCAAALACDEGVTTPELSESVPAEVETFATLVNQHRVSVGCEPLTWHTGVAQVAQAHSADMVERGFFAHTNPDGQSPFDRMRAAGIDFGAAAENIAYGYPDAASVLQGWLDSPGHRANIENCGLEQHGVGLVGTHWTHLFANVR